MPKHYQSDPDPKIPSKTRKGFTQKQVFDNVPAKAKTKTKKTRKTRGKKKSPSNY